MRWLEDHPELRHPNGAVYFPRPLIGDALARRRPRAVPASGTMAGLYARTDAARGVWKAPAGVDAVLAGVAGLEHPLNDAELGRLNPLAINGLRELSGRGFVAWGARTLDGADPSGSEWRYVPVRRTALFLIESLVQGTRWAVFEPNDPALWAALELAVGTFLYGLYQRGAFQGTKPSDAYFVRCDPTTTTAADINRGIVNILVGFAPLKPAEFVIIKIQQLAGQIQA